MAGVKTLPALLLIVLAAALTGCNLVREDAAPTLTPVLTVSFQEPPNMAQVREGEEITLLLLAEDRGGSGVVQVDLLVDDRPHQQGSPEVETAVPVFAVSMRWRATTVGLHSLTAVAYRADGAASTPATIALEVVP